jgi:hypothetical protein
LLFHPREQKGHPREQKGQVRPRAYGLARASKRVTLGGWDMAQPLTVTYRDDSLDGRRRLSWDDQVPHQVAASGTWERYVAAERRYVDGVLVAVVYVLDG